MILYFKKTLDDGDISDEVRNFVVEDLHDCYSMLVEFKENIQHVSLPKKKFCAKKHYFLSNYLPFCTQQWYYSVEQTKWKGSRYLKFLSRTWKGIINDKTYTHHLHISGEIIGYAHRFCKAKVRENKCKITVVA